MGPGRERRVLHLRTRTNIWYHRFGESKSTKVTNFSEATLFNGAISPDGRSMLVTRGPLDQDAF